MTSSHPAERPWVKICGITRVEDAELAIALGADYLGLNFYPKSPRALGEAEAREIANAVGGRIPLVGVFVNSPIAKVEGLAAKVPLDLLQFHGDETPEEIAPLGSRAIKALRFEESAGPPDLEAWGGTWGFLLEARHPRLYGGAGRSWRYEKIAGLTAGRRVFVAGGIRPETAVEALSLSRAWGLDVCSGVETTPGVKDAARLTKLFEEIRDAQATP